MAKAHTQGLEVSGGSYYVTARREDVRPKRAILLRLRPAATNWEVWDITAVAPPGLEPLDHPGGMQSDGKRLWIPVSESKPKSRSLIRVFALSGMLPGHPPTSDFEFAVNDHIGALAMAADRGWILGANWDTESVYVWDLEGNLKRTLTRPELDIRGLGVSGAGEKNRGVAIQDWKVLGNRLFCSGLCKTSGVVTSPRSRFISFANFLETDFRPSRIALPWQSGTELAREAMAIVDGLVLFLPEDLGASNRIFRLSLPQLLKSSLPE